VGWKQERLMARTGSNPPSDNRRVRVRSRPLEQIDEAKLAVALSIMARRLLEQRAAESENLADDAPAEGREVA
jgi:hypothetical protein